MPYGVIVKSSTDKREEDYRELEQTLARTRDPKERRAIQGAMETLRRERNNPRIRAMREALIRESRAGRLDNIKDIHDVVSKDSSYRNGR